jgi:K+-sensing histidine kinase KdpD
MDFVMAGPIQVPWNRSVLLPAAAIVPLVLCAILSAWRQSVTAATAVLVLVAVVVAAAATGDRLAGVIAALSSAVWFDFFLTEPYLRLTINDANDVEATVLLLVIGTLVTEVALWGRRQQSRASRRAGYLDGLLGTAELVLAPTDSVDELVEQIGARMTGVLGVARCRFVPGASYDARMAVMDHDGIVTRLGRTLDVERHGLPTDDETVLLVRRNGDVVGHFLITSAADVARPSLEQRRVAVLMADQVASLLGRRTG